MKLKELRLNNQLTQTELAKRIEITQFTYSNYEKEKTQPDIKTLITIADFYNVSLDYLCDRPFNNNLGYIPEERKETIKTLLQLSENEFKEVSAFIRGFKTGK